MKRKPGKANRKNRKRSSDKVSVRQHKKPLSKRSDLCESDKFRRLEFHRHGFALIPRVTDLNSGIAVQITPSDSKQSKWVCSCGEGGECKHQKELIVLSDLLIGVHQENLNYTIKSH